MQDAALMVAAVYEAVKRDEISLRAFGSGRGRFVSEVAEAVDARIASSASKFVGRIRGYESFDSRALTRFDGRASEFRDALTERIPVSVQTLARAADSLTDGELSAQIKPRARSRSRFATAFANAAIADRFDVVFAVNDVAALTPTDVLQFPTVLTTKTIREVLLDARLRSLPPSTVKYSLLRHPSDPKTHLHRALDIELDLRLSNPDLNRSARMRGALFRPNRVDDWSEAVGSASQLLAKKYSQYPEGLRSYVAAQYPYTAGTFMKIVDRRIKGWIKRGEYSEFALSDKRRIAIHTSQDPDAMFEFVRAAVPIAKANPRFAKLPESRIRQIITHQPDTYEDALDRIASGKSH